MRMRVFCAVLSLVALCAGSACHSNSDRSTGSAASSASSTPPVNKLDTGNVQRAVDQMVAGVKTGGTVTVLGVRTTPDGAEADLSFNNFTANFGSHTSPGSPEQNSFSGNGTAEIVKYTDGRTILKSVVWNFGLNVSGQIPL